MVGRLVAIEGIDGSGSEEQTSRLIKYLKKQGIPCELFTYPDYSNPMGKAIHDWLHSKDHIPVEGLFLIYAGDMIKDIQKIKSCLREGKTVVLDRYFATTIAYQGTQGFPRDKALRFAELFGMPEPDISIYLKISAETSMERKKGEKENLDRNEANKEFLSKVSESFDELVKDSVFGSWFVVDGEKSKQEVFDQIIKILRI